MGSISLLFIIPFLPFFVPASATIIAPYYIREAFTVLIAALLILIYYRKTQTIIVRMNLAQVFMLVFVTILICQIPFLDSYINYSFEAIAVIIIGVLLSVIIFNLSVEAKDKLFKIISKAIILCCYIQICICILQLNNIGLSFSSKFYSFDLTNSAIVHFNLLTLSEERIGGGLNQANNLADLLAWGLLANVVNSINKNKWHLILAYFTMIIISIFISLTFSRIAVLFALFMIGYGVVIFRKEKCIGKQLLVHGITLSICILIAAKGYFNFAYANYNVNTNNHTSNNARIETSLNMLNNLAQGKSSNLSASDSQRTTLWKRGWHEFIEHPLYGNGWNYYSKYLFESNIQAKTKPLPQLALPMNAHNIFIQVLATTGILGFLCVVGFFCAALYSAWKQDVPKQVLIFGIICILLIHSQVEYPLFYVQFLYCLFILVGLSNNKAIYSLKNVKLFKLISILISTLAIWQIIIGINYFLILAQLKKPANYIANNPLHNIMIKYQMAANPFWSYYVDANFAEKLDFDKITPENKKLFDLTYTATKNVEEFTPFPSFTIKLAYMEQLRGNTIRSQELINKVLNSYPDFRANLRDSISTIAKGNPAIQTSMLKQLDAKP